MRRRRAQVRAALRAEVFAGGALSPRRVGQARLSPSTEDLKMKSTRQRRAVTMMMMVGGLVAAGSALSGCASMCKAMRGCRASDCGAKCHPSCGAHCAAKCGPK
jgi:hypothetical protein